MQKTSDCLAGKTTSNALLSVKVTYLTLHSKIHIKLTFPLLSCNIKRTKEVWRGVGVP